MMNRIWKQRDDLVIENQRLEERIKLLEEACREMVSEEDTHIRLQTWLKAKQYIQLQTWLKAKEAKP
jgi:hypothetical protein